MYANMYIIILCFLAQALLIYYYYTDTENDPGPAHALDCDTLEGKHYMCITSH